MLRGNAVCVHGIRYNQSPPDGPIASADIGAAAAAAGGTDANVATAAAAPATTWNAAI